MLMGCLSLLPGVTTFNEDHPAAFAGHKLLSIKRVREIAREVGSAAIVFKPLVESHRAVFFLNRIERVKILWIFRNPEKVILSHVNTFGEEGRIQSLKTVKSVIEGSHEYFKLYQEPSIDEMQKTVSRLYKDDLNHESICALWWLIRNEGFLRTVKPDHASRILYVDYDKYTQTPEAQLGRICRFLEVEFSNDAVKGVEKPSRWANTLAVEPTILAECQKTFARLRAAEEQAVEQESNQ